MRAKPVLVGKRAKPAQPVVPAPKSKLVGGPIVMMPSPGSGPARFKIEKGVPLLARVHRGGGRQRMYPLDQLERGDSFFVPGPSKSIVGAASYWAKVSKRQFTTRPCTENGVKGARVWRVK